jgi:hypothetical protein
MMKSAVANRRSFSSVEQTGAFSYGALLRRCYGTELRLQFPHFSGVAAPLRKGGFSPFLRSAVAVLFLGGPQLLRRPSAECSP